MKLKETIKKILKKIFFQCDQKESIIVDDETLRKEIVELKEEIKKLKLEYRFIKDNNNVIFDKETDLEWLVGPDWSMKWDEAKEWVDCLGDRWRLPTIEELKTLYQEGLGTRNISPLFEIPGWQVWSVGIKDSAAAWYFDFIDGVKKHNSRSCWKCGYMAFAVRERKESKKDDMDKYSIYTITTTAKDFVFSGKYRRDLETDNWHYYEKQDGTIIHFRKNHIIAVEGDTAEIILENRKQ